MALLRVNAGVAALLVLLATASLLVAPPHAIKHKCSACKAVGRELYRRMSEEDLSDKKDLDLRYGLDPNGKRKGRILPYKESELRATELIDVRRESGGGEGEEREGIASCVALRSFYKKMWHFLFISDTKNQTIARGLLSLRVVALAVLVFDVSASVCVCLCALACS